MKMHYVIRIKNITQSVFTLRFLGQNFFLISYKLITLGKRTFVN
jgi:hypothetical protein